MWKSFLIFCGTLCINHVQAVTLNVDIQGTTVKWRDADIQSNGLSPSNWFLSHDLPSASAFTQYSVSMPSSVVLKKGGVSVNLPLSVVGFQYMSPKAQGLETYSYGGSELVTRNASRIEVSGVGKGDKIVRLSGNGTPITHLRPVLGPIDSDYVINAFTKSNAHKGHYSGQVVIKLAYDYISSVSKVRARYHMFLPLNITINYTPSVLNTVLSPCLTSAKMKTNYDRRDSVSGYIVCQFRASGVLPYGITLSLKDRDDYLLTGPNGKTIPYSVSCNECTDNILVDNNTVKKAKTQINNDNKASSIPFSLRIHFDDKDLSQLKTGKYRDDFMFIVEPRV